MSNNRTLNDSLTNYIRDKRNEQNLFAVSGIVTTLSGETIPSLSGEIDDLWDETERLEDEKVNIGASLTADYATVMSDTGLTASVVTITELSYLTGANSNIQDQLDDISDHGSLTGLGDDDHTQYLLIDGTRDMTGDLDMDGNQVVSCPGIYSDDDMYFELFKGTQSTVRFRNDVSGSIQFEIEGNMEISGDIVTFGDIDGVDIAAFKSDFDDLEEQIDGASFYNTESGMNSNTFTNHYAMYITCYNDSGATINQGDLVCYDDDTSPIYNVKARDAQDELPIGVALETASDGNTIMIAIDGFVDVKLYTDTWKSTTVGEKSSAQNFPIRCSYVRGNYEKCILDDFFGNVTYDMSGYGHLLGTAVSEAGSGYDDGWVRVKLNIVQQSKAPLEAMTHGGDVTLWLRHFETDAEPADGSDMDDWYDLTPWGNDFEWGQYPSGSEPTYDRDGENRHGQYEFTVGNYDNMRCDVADTYLHDNSDGLSVFAWGNFNADTDCIIAKYNISGADRCFFLRTNAILISEDGTYDANLVKSFTRPTSFASVGFVWGTGEVATTYVDGSSTGATTSTCTSLPDSTPGSALYVGCERHRENNNLDGDLAEVVTFKHKLSSGELSALVDEGEERYKI